MQTANKLGSVDFYGDSGSSDLRGAGVAAAAETVWTDSSAPTRLEFSTTERDASSPTDRMVVTGSGNVLVGGTLPDEPNITLNADGRASFSTPTSAPTNRHTLVAYNSSPNAEVTATIYAENDAGGRVWKGWDGTKETSNIWADGKMQIGGVLPAAPNISLNPNGSASFANTVTSGGIPSTATGAVLDGNVGELRVQRNGNTEPVLRGYNSAGTQNITLNANGSANFAGDVKNGTFNTSSNTTQGAYLGSGGNIIVQRQSTEADNSKVLSGYKGTSEQWHVTNGGSATFAGKVTAATFDLESLSPLQP